jgi:hypothetical protein
MFQVVKNGDHKKLLYHFCFFLRSDDPTITSKGGELSRSAATAFEIATNSCGFSLAF